MYPLYSSSVLTRFISSIPFVVKLKILREINFTLISSDTTMRGLDLFSRYAEDNMMLSGVSSKYKSIIIFLISLVIGSTLYFSMFLSNNLAIFLALYLISPSFPEEHFIFSISSNVF